MRALIGCFVVNWHLTMEQFSAKIFTNLWRQRVKEHCYLRTLTARARIIFINLYTKKVFLRELYNFFPKNFNVSQINCFPRNQSIRVYLCLLVQKHNKNITACFCSKYFYTQKLPTSHFNYIYQDDTNDIKIINLVIFLDFHSTKQGLPLVDS